MNINTKDFIPPIILKAGKVILNHFKGMANGDAHYDNYASALEKCDKNDYQNIELCKSVADKTIVFRDGLSQQLNSLNSINVFLLSAINQAINEQNLKSISILDFGGACGAHYFEIREFLPKSFPLKWMVIETPQMVLSAKSRDLETNELTFLDNMNELPKIDFIYSSGALQYTPKPYEFLQELLSIGAKSILFNRMMFNENDSDIVTVQSSLLSENGHGPLLKQYTDKVIKYPHTTLSFNKFNSTVLKSYQLIWIFNEDSGSHKIGNEKIIGRGLYYTLKDSDRDYK